MQDKHRSSFMQPGNRDCWRTAALLAALFAGLSAVYWLAVLGFVGEAGFPLDDSYIHLQFARNLFEDGQMAFNPGIPSSGSTAPGYPLLLAAFFAFTRDWYLASYLLGAVASLGTALCAAAILRRWTGDERVARLGGVLTVVTHPTLVQAFGGMETSVYSLLFLLGLLAYGEARGRLLASLFFSLNVWFRPEMLLLLPLIGLERLLAAVGQRRLTDGLKECARHGAIWAAVVSLYLAYNWHQDGHLLPSTFAAKAVFHYSSLVPPWLDGLPSAIAHRRWLNGVLALTVWPAVLALSACLGMAVNCLPLAARLPDLLATVRHRWESALPGWRLGVMTLAAFPLARGAVDPLGVFFLQAQRYFAHLTPLFIVLILASSALYLDPEVRRPMAGWLRRAAPRVMIAAALVGTLLQGAHAVVSVSNINDMQVRMGEWIAAHTPPDQLVAINDIGAAAFIGERKVLDMIGLVEPELVAHQLKGGSLKEYLGTRRPGLVIIFPWWFPQLAADPALERIHSIRLGLNVACGGSELVVYRPRWGADPAGRIDPGGMLDGAGLR